VSDLTGNVLEWTSTPSPRGPHAFLISSGNFADTDPDSLSWAMFSWNVDDDHSPIQGARCVAPVAP
jgi:formylglycine-generating enzyme required for sulfatase activity